SGTPCNSGNLCMQGGTCQGGMCTGANPVVCVPPDTCNTSACDPLTGQCKNTPKPQWSSCDDKNPCTGGDICGFLGCSGTKLGDGTPCPGGVCMGGVCVPGGSSSSSSSSSAASSSSSAASSSSSAASSSSSAASSSSSAASSSSSAASSSSSAASSSSS